MLPNNVPVEEWSISVALDTRSWIQTLDTLNPAEGRSTHLDYVVAEALPGYDFITPLTSSHR